MDKIKPDLKYVCLLIWLNFLFSAYLKNIPTIITQPNGTSIDCFMSGDEFFNYLHDEKGHTIIQNSLDGYYYYAEKENDVLVTSTYLVNSVNPTTIGIKKHLLISKSKYKEKRNNFLKDNDSRDAPTIGTINNINIFIRFSDQEEFETTRSDFNDLYNNSEGPSLYHYYKEVSYELLTVNTIHFPICDPSINISYQDDYPRSYYSPYNQVTNPDGYQSSEEGMRERVLLENAIAFIKEEIPIDLNFDEDLDGIVDNISFLIRGETNAWSELLWPHKSSMTSSGVYINGSLVGTYNFNIESRANLGTISHEFFHSLGAPDLYHYFASGLPSPIGGWGLMASSSGPKSMSSYMKYKYTDWIVDLPVIEQSGTYEIYPLSNSSNNIYRVNSPYSTNEFFVLEYRVKEGLYEINIPGEDDGLAIYRVNEDFNGNASGPPDMLYIYRSDGTLNEQGNLNEAVFSQDVGRDQFNDVTNPSCFLSDGSFGTISIKNIGSPGETIQFDLENINLIVAFGNIISDTNSNGSINPNETVEITLSIENVSPINFQNVIATVSTENVNIDIENSQLFFGAILSDQNSTGLVTMNIGNVMGNIPFIVSMDVLYEVNNETINYNYQIGLILDVNIYQNGFPYIDYTGSLISPPNIIDLDNNGEYEIICSNSNGYIYAINSNGEPVLNNIFPYQCSRVYALMAVADIDNDGFDDIVIPSSFDLIIFDKDGEKNIINTDSRLNVSPAIGNIDEDDELEIVAGGDGSEINNFYVFNSDGSNVFTNNLNISGTISKGFALADFNNNYQDDIVFGTKEGQVYLIYDDGTIADGFPFTNQFGYYPFYAPLIVEDYSGEKLIIIACEHDIFGIEKNGVQKFHIETPLLTAGLSILEVENNIYIYSKYSDDIISFDLDGNIISSFDTDIYSESSIVFSDLDLDGSPEIIIKGGYYLNIYNLDGTLFNDFSLVNTYNNNHDLTVIDFDNDLDMEITGVNTFDNSIYVIDTPFVGTIDGYWNMYQGNNEHTGFYQGCVGGDLDYSSHLNVVDIIIFIDYILEATTLGPFQLCQVDLNNDESTNIFDLILLIEMILDA